MIADAVLLPTPTVELICHNDLAPWNLVIGDRWVFIDWDGAGVSSRLWDLAYAAHSFTLLDDSTPPQLAATRLAAFVDGYQADGELRTGLPAAMIQRTEAMYDLLATSHASGREPWGSMFRCGHGDHWLAATKYVKRHQPFWARALSTDRQ